MNPRTITMVALTHPLQILLLGMVAQRLLSELAGELKRMAEPRRWIARQRRRPAK